MLLLDLFLSFFKIGMFSFGGGYAVLSFLQQVVVDKDYMTLSEFADIVAISQITPGPIAVNLATFVGFTQAGIVGSLVATLGVAMPSFIIIIIAVKFIMKFRDSQIIQDILHGLKPAVCGLIFVAAVQISESEFIPHEQPSYSWMHNIEWVRVIIAVVVFVLMYKYKLNPILLIICSAITGIILGFIGLLSFA